MSARRINSVKLAIYHATRELHTIVDCRHEPYCGTALKIKDILKTLQSATEELEQIERSIP